MIEKMVPTFLWDDEFWVLYKLNNLAEAKGRLKYCDGNVENIIINFTKGNDYSKNLDGLFGNYPWIDKIILLKDDELLIGVFQNKNK